MTTEPVARSGTPRFLWLFALAWAGGAIAYVPFLTILLPLRVVAFSGPDKVQVLAAITFFGAIAASVGNIFFGWLSDRTGTRRPWIVVGLFLSQTLLLLMPLGKDSRVIVALVVCWQLALNMMLCPLSAWAADRVSRDQTGLLGGLMAISPAMGALSGVVVTIPELAGADHRLWLVTAMVVCFVLPAILFIGPSPLATPGGTISSERSRLPFTLTMWLARLLVQIAEAALFAFLLLYFRSLDPVIGESRVARLFGAVVVAAVPIAVLAGRWADRSARSTLPLAICAFCSGLGLVALLLSSRVEEAMLAYIWFGLATTVFLSLHSGQTLLVLPSPANRGRDLGLFNLTNTVPFLIMPWLAVMIVPQRGFTTLFGILALLAFVSSAMLFRIKRLN